MNFPSERILRCKNAMRLPAPQGALRLIASGRVTVQVAQNGDILLDTLDGRPVRERGRKVAISGAWALVPAGMVDELGRVTAEGSAFLASLERAGL